MEINLCKLPNRDRLRKIGLNINGEYPCSQKHNEDIKHLFNQCEMAKNI